MRPKSKHLAEVVPQGGERLALFAVLKEYNRLLLTYGTVGHTKKANDKNMVLIASYAKWCATHSVDPVAFTTAVVQQVYDETGRIPPLSRLKSKRLLKNAEWEEKLSRNKVLQSDERRSEKIDHKAGYKLKVYGIVGSRERLKARYEGRRQLCSQWTDLHGGYHPQSKWCSACPQLGPCYEVVVSQYGAEVAKARLSVRPDQVVTYL